MKRVMVNDVLGVSYINYYNCAEDMAELTKFVDNPPVDLEEFDASCFDCCQTADKENGLVLDFDGVQINKLWRSEEFRKLFNRKNLFMIIHNSADDVRTYDSMCKLQRSPTGRVINVDHVVDIDRVPDKAERRLADTVDWMLQCVSRDNGGRVCNIDIASISSQLGTRVDMLALTSIAMSECEVEGTEAIKINIGGIRVSSGMVETLSDIIRSCGELGCRVSVYTDDSEVSNKLKFWEIAHSSRLSDGARADAIASTVPVGTVGLLTKYKSGVGRDEFGRRGHGEVATSLPARFDGICTTDNNGEQLAACKFTVWNYKKNGMVVFNTAVGYFAEYDVAKHPGLVSNEVVVPVASIGLQDMFFGATHHFEAVDDSRKDNTLYTLGEDGVVDAELVSLHRYIECVLNSFEVEYKEVWKNEGT